MTTPLLMSSFQDLDEIIEIDEETFKIATQASKLVARPKPTFLSKTDISNLSKQPKDAILASLAQHSLPAVPRRQPRPDRRTRINEELSKRPLGQIGTAMKPQVPYKVQYTLLTKLQCELEASCYEWGVKHHPLLLQMRKWDSPEAVEIKNWEDVFRLNPAPPNSVDMNYVYNDSRDMELRYPQTLEVALREARRMRNACVHRQRLETTALMDYVAFAFLLTRILKDERRSGQLAKVHQGLARLPSFSEEGERELSRLAAREEALMKEINELRVEQDRLRITLKYDDSRVGDAVLELVASTLDLNPVLNVWTDFRG